MLNTKKTYMAYFDTKTDDLLIEGSKTKVFAFVKKNYNRQYKKGEVRIGYHIEIKNDN